MPEFPGYRPTATQELLLQAALMPPEQAAAAWRAWCDRVHLENDPLDLGSYLLLAAIYASLSGDQWAIPSPSQPDFPWRTRLQGVWRRTWGEAQLHNSACLPLLAELQQAAVPFLLLPGEPAPVAPHRAAHSPAPLGKFELLIGPGHRKEALALLTRFGWQPNGPPLKRLVKKVLTAPTFQDFSNGGQGHLRLRWRLFDLPSAELAEVNCWSSAVTARLAHLDVRVLAPAERLLYLSFAAGTWTPRPRIELIPSFVSPIRAAGADMDWDSLRQKAADCPAQPFVHGLLAYAARRLALPVPASLLTALAQTPEPPTSRQFLRLHAERSPDATLPQRVWWFARHRWHYARAIRTPGRGFPL